MEYLMTQQEQEANDFAAELLAPSCVMSKLGVKSAEQLRKYGLISPEQALRHIDNINPSLPSTAVEKALCERFRLRHIQMPYKAIIAVVATLGTICACLGIINHQSRTEGLIVPATAETVEIPSLTAESSESPGLTVEHLYETSEEQTLSPENNAEITVYITRTGKKYHKPDCYHISGKTGLIELTISEAEQAGYEPCKDCYPERQ